MMLYIFKEVSEIGFNTIIKSYTTIQCSRSKYYQYNYVVVILIFTSLSSIEPEVDLMGIVFLK